MRTRKCAWYDAKNQKPMYGFEVLHKGQWMHAMDNNGPLIFETEEARDAARAKAKKQKEGA